MIEGIGYAKVLASAALKPSRLWDKGLIIMITIIALFFRLSCLFLMAEKRFPVESGEPINVALEIIRGTLWALCQSVVFLAFSLRVSNVA